MLKVFLVEDEFTVREKMKRNMNWEENDFCLVGEASDGEIAYPMIEETKPDIIITDIKMPFMDGLQLSKLVKQRLPQTKIIILSGYDEFEYAKEALSLGVTEYLLKPIAAKKLLEAMKSVAAIIEKEREQQEYYEKYKLNQEDKDLVKKRFFHEMITYKMSAVELLEKARAIHIDLMAPMYNVLLIKLLFVGGTINSYEEMSDVIDRQMKAWVEQEKNLILFNWETEGWAMIVKGSQTDIVKEEEEALNQLKSMLENLPNSSYCIGVGQRVLRLSEIGSSFEAASKALAYRYLLSTEPIIYFDKLAHYNITLDHENISIKNVDVTKFDKKTIENFLKSGIKSEVAQFVHGYLESMGTGTDSLLFRQYIIMDIYFNVVGFIEQLGYKAECILEICGDIKQITSVIQTKEGAKTYLESLLTEAISLRDGVSSNRYMSLLDEAKAYIEEHYNKEYISLNSVAEYVNISPSHFSTIFSQETGQTFISYLTEIRMKKAKELLRCSSMKTLEVGYAVGYRDPHYFSYLFKKIQNCTPKEYRKANKS